MSNSCIQHPKSAGGKPGPLRALAASGVAASVCGGNELGSSWQQKEETRPWCLWADSEQSTVWALPLFCGQSHASSEWAHESVCRWAGGGLGESGQGEGWQVDLLLQGGETYFSRERK